MTETAALPSEVTARSLRGGRGDALRQAMIIAAAVLGNMASVTTVVTYTMGIFISTLHQDYGWSRADTSLSMTWFTIVGFLGSALIGRVADRLDPGRLAAVSMLAIGMTLLLMPHVVHSVISLWIAYFVLAVVGLGTSPAVLNKPVIAAFSRRRGLAIGVALTGTGFGGFVVPRVTTALIERGSWKLGYFGLGCFALVVAPIIWLALRRRRPASSLPLNAPLPVYLGLPFRAAFRSRIFWLLSAISLFGGLGMSGPALHLIPFLRDHAVNPAGAAALASLLGVGSVVGRIITGFTLDRVDGPLVGLPLLGAGVLGIILLVLFGVHIAAAAVLLLGFVIGSEIDLLAYFPSRYFGLRAHATLFGWNYGLVGLGAAVGPVVVGALRDRLGDYGLGLTLSSGALALAALLCPLLGPYRYAAHLKQVGEA